MPQGMRLSRIPRGMLLAFAVGALWVPQAPAAPARKPAAARAETPKANLQPITQAIRAQVKGKLAGVYASRNYAPIWASSGRIGPEADSFIAFLESSNLDGLNPSSYKVEELKQAIAASRAGDPAAIAFTDLQLSQALSRYIPDMRKPRNVGMIYADRRLKPKKPKPDAALRAASMAKPFSAYISNMGWMSPQYVRIRQLLAQAEKSGSSQADMERISLNLDRARALPGPWMHHIVVDAASGRLWYYQAGKEAGTMRVITGTERTPTPMLAGMVQYAILNPYWNVPTDFAQRSIAPKILSGRTLASMNMEALSDWSATPAKLDPETINWHAIASGEQEIRLRQLPGPFNSMGRVKFLFPNAYGIYLHDTPEKDLFAKPDRHFSNGCVRLEDAARLANWLMGKPLGKTPKGVEQAVPLSAPVPIFVTYLTVSGTGREVTFLPDIYGRDQD